MYWLKVRQYYILSNKKIIIIKSKYNKMEHNEPKKTNGAYYSPQCQRNMGGGQRDI